GERRPPKCGGRDATPRSICGSTSEPGRPPCLGRPYGACYCLPRFGMELAGKKVVVTGGAGFLGRHVVAELKSRGALPVSPRQSQYDLIDRMACRRLVADHAPDLVMHLAAPGRS